MEDYATWQQFCEANPKLAVAMLRIDRFAEPLRSAMIAAIEAILDALDAAVHTSWEAEMRAALAAGAE